MRNFHRIWASSQMALCSLVLTGLCALPLQAKACTVDGMNRFLGQWYGQGNVQEDRDAALESVACRIIFDAADVGHIVTRGLCATANETREISGYLACVDGRLAGPLLTSVEEPEPLLISSSATEQELILELEGIHPDRGDPLRFRLRVSFDGPDAMTMRITQGVLNALSISYEREAP